MVGRSCSALKNNGEPCRAAPLREGEFCRFHSPDHADEVAETRKLGGLRRRRERTVAGAYDFEGLHTVDEIRRLLEIAAVDTISLENSVARSRTLASIAQVALKALEVRDLEERLRALEAVIAARPRAARGTK